MRLRENDDPHDREDPLSRHARPLFTLVTGEKQASRVEACSQQPGLEAAARHRQYVRRAGVVTVRVNLAASRSIAEPLKIDR